MRSARPAAVVEFGLCSECRRRYALRDDGTVYGHRPRQRGTGQVMCPGSRQDPARAA